MKKTFILIFISILMLNTVSFAHNTDHDEENTEITPFAVASCPVNGIHEAKQSGEAWVHSHTTSWFSDDGWKKHNETNCLFGQTYQCKHCRGIIYIDNNNSNRFYECLQQLDFGNAPTLWEIPTNTFSYKSASTPWYNVGWELQSPY